MKNNYKTLILKNPELTRNIWVELTSTRLLVMPLILSLFLLLIYAFSDNFANSVVLFSNIMFNIIVFIWGSKLAADSVISEINERTWDNQVLSLNTPWQMTIGKLFGSTSYAWYGGIILFILNLIAAFFVDNTFSVIKNSLTSLFNAITVHSVIISLTLIGIKKNRFKAKINSTLYFLIGLLIAWYIGYATSFLYLFENTKFEEFLNFSKVIQWHNISLKINDFMLLSSLAFLIWGVIGLYRNFKTELGYQSGYSVWLAFLVFIVIYTSGFANSIYEFIPSKDLFLVGLFFGFFSILFISYFSLFIESKQITDYKILLKSLKVRDFREFNHLLPLWVVSSFIAIILALLIFIYSLINTKIAEEELFWDFSIFLPLNFVLYLLRDIFFVHFVAFSGRFKKPDFASLVFLILAYSLLPGIISLFELNVLLPMFFPFAESSFFSGTLPVLIQVVIIFFLMKRKYKSSLEKIEMI